MPVVAWIKNVSHRNAPGEKSAPLALLGEAGKTERGLHPRCLLIAMKHSPGKFWYGHSSFFSDPAVSRRLGCGGEFAVHSWRVRRAVEL